MDAVNYWRKQNLIITNGSLVVGVYNRYCKNVHTVGYSGGKRKRIIENIGKVAEQASHTIWKSSFYKNWGNN